MCGIFGIVVHMAQLDDKGYVFYSGLTGFPCTLGHEFSGIVIEARPWSHDKTTNKPFRGAKE